MTHSFPMTFDELQPYFQLAQDAVREVGVFLKSKARDEVLSAQGKDIKLLADIESEAFLIDFIRKHNNLPILTEERGFLASDNASDLLWVIDPLDGSYNFHRGIPLCCVSLALCHKKQPIFGIIYDFNRDEFFQGLVGQGASVNGHPIRVGSKTLLSEASLFTGFPLKSDYRELDFSIFASRCQKYKKVRMIGSAALSLAYVASGRGDIYREDGIMLWDVAAGLAIVSAAGGYYQMTSYKAEKEAYTIYASNHLLPNQEETP